MRRDPTGEKVIPRALLRCLSPVFLLLLSGCTAVGPGTIADDRGDYSRAIARSRDEHMLLNIVRTRYLQIPDFLTVSSVITSYTYGANMGISGLLEDNRDNVGGAGGLSYTEKPTISYAPLAGSDFSRRLLQPIPIEVIFSLGQAGWPLDIVMAIALQRINDVENMSFSQVPAPGDVNLDRQFRIELDRLRRFERLIGLMLNLSSQGAIEVLRGGSDVSGAACLHVCPNLSPDVEGLVGELRTELGLDPGLMEFVITNRLTARVAGEITMRTRSVLSIMSFLARGIDVPEDDLESGRVVVMPPMIAREVLPRIPLRVRSSEARPVSAYAAVKYRGHWFYIDDSDIRSKRAFATLLIFFQLQAPTSGPAAPLLTLPAGD